MLRIFLAALLLTFGSSAFAQTSSSLTFPRLGLIAIGSPHDYERADRQATFAKYDMVILNIWPNWEGGRSMNMEQVIGSIKGRNAGTKVFLYVMNAEFDDFGAANAWPELNSKLFNNGWWLYSNGGGGSRVKSTWGDTHFTTNNTRFSPRDSSGENFMEYFARFTVDRFLVPNPSADGFFLDGVFWRPRVNGDWNRDGVTDDMKNPTAAAWLRQGFRDQFDLFRQRAPGKLMIGNIADWGESEAVFPELDRILDGGVMESMVGQTWSVESWGGWAAMMTWYRKMLNATVGPRLTMFAVDGAANDYRTFRYSYASCLLDDGVFHYNPTFSSPFAWFDEYDNKLGKAISVPATSAWKNGVYRRDFERGIVLVNPKGNGAQTVDLDQEFRRIAGTQDPAVNNGQITRQVTLQDRDGIVLMRVTARALPLPPSGVRVE
jgi:hypothetical protein